MALSNDAMTTPLDPAWEALVLGARPATLHDAIVHTVAYSDVFHYPLKSEEIHRYLLGWRVSLSAVRAALADQCLVPDRLTQVDECYTLPGRESTVETRRRRARISAELWAKATYWGHRLAGLPFVRMVAVTGALSVDNSEAGDDLDYLIVTEPGRLWLCRGLVVSLVRMAARRGDILCPNYFISERALIVKERTLYTAHEMAQMVPLSGLELYQRMRQLNPWVEEWLPNATGLPRPAPEIASSSHTLRLFAEGLLRTPAGGWLENWEMRRKLRKLSRQGAASLDPGESEFGPDWCKGHFHAHAQQTAAAMDHRLRDLEP